MDAPRRSDRRAGRRALLPTAVLAVLSLVPLAWALVSSLRPSREIFSNLYPLTWATFVPSEVSLDNYMLLLQGPFARALGNSILVALLSVLLGLVLSSTAAYALAVIRFPLRGFIFGLIVVSFLIPFEAIAIPLATSFREWGLANSYTGLILPAIGNGLAIFLLRQFYLGIPPSLAEAARVDGLGWWGIYRRIYLPLSKGAMVGAGIILFNFQWQAFLWPLLIAPRSDMRVAAVALADFSQEAGVDFGQMFAGTIAASAIPLILLLVFQKQFTGSLATAGEKE